MRTAFSGLVGAVLLGCAVAAPLSAQNSSTAPLVVDLMKDIDGAATKFIALAKAMPPAKMSWRPDASARSTGEVFLHVASDNYLLPSGFGNAIPASTGIKGDDFKTLTTYEKRALTGEQIVADLEQSFAHLKASMAKTTSDDLMKPVTMFGMKSTAQGMWILTATHLHEHLGQLIAYARSNGVTPPWSK